MGEVLLTDVEVAQFVVNGYHVVHVRPSDGVHQEIGHRLDTLDHNPGDGILDEVPLLQSILDDPVVTGALRSLLGDAYALQSHRHWHCKDPGTAHMQWHQDSTNRRDNLVHKFLGLYYPREVTAEMGPTMILPATQYRNAPSDRMATYSNVRGQVALTVPAGTFAITHYDLWHGTAANRSAVKRHMVKFLFNRTEGNSRPTWGHDPASLGQAADWNQKDSAGDPGNILLFSNPLGVSQSDHYKERALRQQAWRYLLGQGKRSA